MPMQEPDQHVSPIKTPKQLIIVVVLAFVVPIGLAILLSQLVTSGVRGAHEDDSAIMARIQPVGQVVLAGPRVPLTGEQIYGQVCKTCHETGLLNAPKFGDKAAWAKVIVQGQAVTVGHALNGYNAMPAKGGNPDFENVDVERAVVFMANKAGATWKEPAGKAPAASAAAPVAAPAAAPVASAAAAPAPVAVAAAAPAAAAKPDGRKIFESTCTVCHGAGIAGAPKFGDKAAWAPRLATGIDTLYKVALAGKGAMPAKGGNTSLSDAEVKAAVDYMAAAAR
ncbi:MAG: c-type cytochrome [Casimicrobiaceae bacterium]